MTQNYDESSVRVLKGLEPVKERPGMYTRTTDPTHICQEVIDNAADEALGGFARKIAVTVHLDGSLSVEDDGRGIPVGLHPQEGVPVVELVFTRLHAGGKFNKKDGGAYAFSGGLHGVGVSVTNALSTRLEVEVKRDGGVWRMAFSGGDVVEPLAQVGECGARTAGTRVRVWPDSRYFESPRYSMAELERLLRAKAVLLPGVSVSLVHEKPGGEEVKVWQYPDGLKSYLAELCNGDEPVAPLFAGEAYIGPDHEQFAPGEGAQWALAWFEDGAGGESYVNLIPTPVGGTHEAGLRAGVFEAVKSFVDHHNLLPRGVKLMAEDVWSKVRFVLSARVLDPQFQGQTKDKLTSRDALRLVSSVSRDPVELWLNQHVDAAKKIAELAIRQAQSRLKSAKKVEKKKGSGVAVLPGKLTDCESEDIERNELFLVEGDSAGGSAKLARDKEYQAILPLRGKVLNSWETDKDQLFSNAEIHDIAVAIGVDPHRAGDEVDLTGLRYGKIAILSDADVDGSHIQVLLLTLFYRHFPRLIELGHIYIAQPPLFRVDVPGHGKNRPPRKLYALDEAEMNAILDRLASEGVRPGSWSISRFKGLGEMNPEQLKDTTMHPDTRRLSRVRVRADAMETTRVMFNMLMGKGEAAGRRSWMEAHGNEVEADI
ncbi:DNA topoisomerase IV subunit B [Paludibacterium paludis]|uniref:DNA topoisomerase 4 subunit B n=1 Tax=Paludibacterium paludis TaxID=1225769 RepID=A0A918NW87_9NEIS|nr:DNA topoisomerase IV subunit B [Paludibacterium paludis]GGY01972.1 DNA topoisomerase 4 subunit B [Paludibacterium paludis]